MYSGQRGDTLWMSLCTALASADYAGNACTAARTGVVILLTILKDRAGHSAFPDLAIGIASGKAYTGTPTVTATFRSS
jgi:hypothetical protein